MVDLKAAWGSTGRLVLESASARWDATFTVDGAELVHDPDALLCAGLLPAMAVGEALELSQPVSGELLRNAEHLVEAFAGWWPDELARVPVVAPVARERRRRREAETVLAFSGGVRSYDALAAAPPAPVVLVVDGMGEVAPPPGDVPHVPVRVTTDLAATLTAAGVPAAAAAPTVVLATVAHALDGVGRLQVASSFGWLDQFAHGSHALTDPWWSGSTAIEVVRAARDRVDCVEAAVGAFDARPVGAESVLTRASLRVLGLAEEWPDVEPVDVAAVAALPIVGPADLAHVAQLVRRLEDGRDPELREALVAAVRSATPAGVAWPAGWARLLPQLGAARSS
jgi:hypothetical protein